MHCDDFTRTDAERRSRLRGSHQPPAPAAGRPRRDDLALRGARDAAHAGLRGRRGQRAGGAERAGAGQRLRSRRAGPARHAGPRRRLRALRRPAPGAEGRPAGRAGRHRLRRAPGAGGGAQRRAEGPLRPRPPGLHPGHRLRQPGPLALQQPALLGDRPRSRSTRRRGGWRAGPIATAGPTTRSRRCRWTPACRRCCAAATTPSPPCSRPTTPSRGCPGCGASGRTA